MFVLSHSQDLQTELSGKQCHGQLLQVISLSGTDPGGVMRVPSRILLEKPKEWCNGIKMP